MKILRNERLHTHNIQTFALSRPTDAVIAKDCSIITTVEKGRQEHSVMTRRRKELFETTGDTEDERRKERVDREFQAEETRGEAEESARQNTAVQERKKKEVAPTKSIKLSFVRDIRLQAIH